MSKKINIEQILNDSHFTGATQSTSGRKLKWAIKEIVEATIDLCAESADTHKIDTGIGEYEEINKNSILNVKQLINYN